MLNNVVRCKVDVGWGGGDIYALNLKASFILVKTSSFNHAKVWSPKLQ